MQRAQIFWERTLIGLGALFYLFEFSHGIHGDASVRYDALAATLRSGHLVPMVYSYVHPLLSAPFLLLGHLYKDGFWWISRFNTFLILGMAWMLARRARSWPGWDGGRTRLLVLLLLGATMFPKHATDYYAEVFCACSILAAILSYQAGRHWLAILAVNLSVWNAMATVFGGGVLLVYFALRSKRWRYLAALPFLPLGFLTENYLKYREFFPAAYWAMQVGPSSPLPYAMGPGFSYPLFFGLLNVLFSFGRGIAFFVPGLWLLFHSDFWRGGGPVRDLLRASLAYLAGLVLVYAKFWCWHGAAFWGPRYFLFASIPASVALASLGRGREGSSYWRGLWIVATLVSCWVACQGVMFGTDFQEDCFRQGHEFEFTCFYVPEYSVLWRVFVVHPPLAGRRVAYLAYFLLVAATLLAGPLRALVADVRVAAGEAWRELGWRAGWRA